jgi:hypothetical protein
MSCSAFISEIVHGPRIPHIVSLTRGPRGAGRSGKKDGPVGYGCAEIHAIGARRPPPLGGRGIGPRAPHAPRRRHGTGANEGERTPNSPLVRKSHAHAHASAGASPIAYTPHATHTQRKRTRPDPLGHETSNQYVL